MFDSFMLPKVWDELGNFQGKKEKVGKLRLL